MLPELANLFKAIELIKGLKEKVEADGMKQEEAYKKYKDTQSGGPFAEVLQGIYVCICTVCIYCMYMYV